MKIISLHLLLAVAMQSFCRADVTSLSAEHYKAFKDSSRFHEIHTTTNLPPTIVALCADDSGRLAEPGQKWEATDVITDAALPRKRLIWAATDGEHYVVHYERGGRAHSFHVLVTTFKKENYAKPKDRWRGVGDKLKDFPAFLDALLSGKLDDRPGHAH